MGQSAFEPLRTSLLSQVFGTVLEIGFGTGANLPFYPSHIRSLTGIDPNTGEELSCARELVRLAMPRRVYTNSHYDYVADVAARILEKKEKLAGYKITHQSTFLRHFTCDMTPLIEKSVKVNS